MALSNTMRTIKVFGVFCNELSFPMFLICPLDDIIIKNKDERLIWLSCSTIVVDQDKKTFLHKSKVIYTQPYTLRKRLILNLRHMSQYTVMHSTRWIKQNIILHLMEVLVFDNSSPTSQLVTWH